MQGKWHDWQLVTTGCTDAVVRRSDDGRTYAKIATAAPAVRELADERDRLQWLATTEIGAPRVLDWIAKDDASTLLTSALPGVPAADLDATAAAAATDGLIRFVARLHALRTPTCPFDRRVDVALRLAAERVVAGLVDEDDFDLERRGRRAADLIEELRAGQARAAAIEAAELAVCHGDLCLPNVHVDPATYEVIGVLDVGRLGVADRHVDLALLARSLAATELNPAYGPTLADRVLDAMRADPWRIAYYRLLDELF